MPQEKVALPKLKTGSGGDLLEEYSCSACSRAEIWTGVVSANAERVGCAHLMFGSLFSFFWKRTCCQSHVTVECRPMRSFTTPPHTHELTKARTHVHTISAAFCAAINSWKKANSISTLHLTRMLFKQKATEKTLILSRTAGLFYLHWCVKLEGTGVGIVLRRGINLI